MAVKESSLRDSLDLFCEVEVQNGAVSPVAEGCDSKTSGLLLFNTG